MRSDLPPWACALAVRSGSLYAKMNWLLCQMWIDAAGGPDVLDRLEWRVSK